MGRLIRHEGVGSRLVQRVKIDPAILEFEMSLARPLSRSVRLNGFATCLRLEEIYWEVLADIARINDCSINALLSYVDREVHLRHGGGEEFQWLDPGCVRYAFVRCGTRSDGDVSKAVLLGVSGRL